MILTAMAVMVCAVEALSEYMPEYTNIFNPTGKPVRFETGLAHAAASHRDQSGRVRTI